MPIGDPIVPHPLDEFATLPMIELWSDKWAVRNERKIWLAVADVQRSMGVFDNVREIDAKLDAYRVVESDVRLWSIRERERRTKHDLKARLEEFNVLASIKWGQRLELMHWGMTSADIVDNIALLRMLTGCNLLGIDDATRSVPFRGIKGPVGTQQDMLDLLGTPDKVQQLETLVGNALGFKQILTNVGQVYPRSIDLQVASQVSTQGVFGYTPWDTIGRGYVNMIAEYSGSQWCEGDVSTSVIRRVALPGIFLCADIAKNNPKPWA